MGWEHIWLVGRSESAQCGRVTLATQKCWRRLFSAPFLATSCCWLSGWDSVCIQVFGGCPTSNLSWQKTFPKRKAFVVVESDRWGSLYTGSFVSGFRSMGDSTQYYRRVEEFTLVRRCQLSPFVGAGNNGDNLRIQYRFIPYG